MPRVPRYGQQRVSTAPLPGARVDDSVPAGAFGVPAALDLSGVQRFAAEVYQRESEKADEIALLDADNQLAELSRTLETEARAKRGKDAMGVGTVVRERYDEGQSKIAAGLANDRQRMAFARRSAMRQQSLFEQVERHAATEGERYAQETTEAALALRVDEAVSRYDDPDAREHAIAEARVIVGMEAERMGLSPEARTLAEEKIVTRAHVGVIDRMLSVGDDRMASQYYQAHQSEIAGEQRGAIEKALEAGSTEGEALRQVDAILAGGGTRTEMLAKVREIEDEKVRRAAGRELDLEFSRMDRAEADDYRVVVESVFDKAERGLAISPTERDALKPKDRIALDEFRKQKASGLAVQTDWATYYELKLQVTSPTGRAEFLRTNLLSFRHKLGESEFKELVDIQAKLRTGGTSDPAVRGILSEQQIVTDMLGDAKIDTNPDEGTEAHKRLTQLRRSIDEAVIAYKRETGKDIIPRDALREIVGALATRHVFVERSFAGDPEIPVGSLREDETGNVYVPYGDIDAAERGDIESRIRQAGGRITRRKVERIFGLIAIGDAEGAQALIAERPAGGTAAPRDTSSSSIAPSQGSGVFRVQ